MREPTLKQATHFLKQIDDLGIPLEQLGTANESGLLSIFLKANFAEIDKDEFKKVCGFVVVPRINDIFELGTAGKKFKIIKSLPCKTLKETKVQIETVGYRIPGPKDLDNFRRKYPRADGEGSIFLAFRRRDVGGSFPYLYGEFGKSWNLGSCGHFVNIGSWRWLVEVVDQETKQPDETAGWREITLVADTFVYHQFSDGSLYGAGTAYGSRTVLKSGEKVKVGKMFAAEYAKKVVKAVPFFGEHCQGIFLAKDLEVVK